jgi:hypothetical protein
LKRLALSLVIVGVGTGPRAEAPGAAFLAIDPSVRAQALGGAQALLAGAESLGHNPAGLALLPVSAEAVATYGALDEGVSYGHAAFARRGAGRGAAFGLAVTGLFVDGGNATDSLGQPVGGSTDAGDIALSAGVGGRLVPNVFWGIAGRGVRSTLAGVSSDLAWAGDVGLLYRLPRASLGVSAHHLGTELKFERDGDPLPASLRFDGAWSRGAWSLLGQARFDLPEHKNRWTAGAEYRTGPLALRGGALLSESGGVKTGGGLEESSFLEKISFGMGFQFKSARLDYALADHGGGDRPWHRLSLTGRWGGDGNLWSARAPGDRLGDPLSKRVKKPRALKGMKKKAVTAPPPAATPPTEKSPAGPAAPKTDGPSRPTLKNFGF